MNGGWEMNAWQLMLAGGPIMAPILLCSLFSLSIVIERMWYFKNISTDVPRLKQQVLDLIKANKIKDAVMVCENNPSPVAKILKAALTKFGSSREDIKEHIEDVSLYEIPKLEMRLNALATIAHLSPLLGLLGTALGIAACFYTIQARASALNPITPGDLAGGMGQALLTTIAGLLVAIPTSVVYNYLLHRVNYFILEMERGATEIVNFMFQFSETNS